MAQIGPCKPAAPAYLASSAQKSMPLLQELQQSPGADLFIGWASQVLSSSLKCSHSDWGVRPESYASPGVGSLQPQTEDEENWGEVRVLDEQLKEVIVVSFWERLLLLMDKESYIRVTLQPWVLPEDYAFAWFMICAFYFVAFMTIEKTSSRYATLCYWFTESHQLLWLCKQSCFNFLICLKNT